MNLTREEWEVLRRVWDVAAGLAERDDVKRAVDDAVPVLKKLEPPPRLKPCPFCGGEAELSLTQLHVQCTRCTATVSVAGQTLATWNRRTP